MKILSKSLIILSLVLISTSFQSCGSSSSIVSMTNQKFEPTNPIDIEIFSSKKPEKDYIEIARISADKFKGILGKKVKGDETNSLLKEKAAAIGGHAIVNITEDFASISGVVIRYK